MKMLRVQTAVLFEKEDAQTTEFVKMESVSVLKGILGKTAKRRQNVAHMKMSKNPEP